MKHTANNQSSSDVNEEANNILKTAAMLIKAEIIEKRYNNEFYPSSSDITNKWIPDSLKEFLSYFTSSTLKQVLAEQ